MAMKPITLANLTRAINKLKDNFVQIKDAVKSVNGNLPDSDGDININRVNLAGELESYSTQYNQGEFINRTSGGSASIEDGDAWLTNIKGKAVKTGFVQEVLEMTVTPMPREEGDPITATLDEDTFKSYVTSSQTVTLNYTTEWSADPATYGITVTGTPIAGDQIEVVYVKGNAGTLTFSRPEKLISTGWNLFNYTTGMAKVVRYSDQMGYRVDGTYTSIQFSASGTGDWSDIDVTDGNFNPPSDGYVKLTGGNSTDTVVYLTWSDWGSGYEWDGEEQGEFSAYTESVIDMSSLFDGEDCPFPYGLLECGSAQDEINLNVGQVISRIDRMENTEENMTIARQSGREYDYDENYIYLVKATAVTTSISIDGAYTVDDHGLEYYDGTTVAPVTQVIYGSSLKNKLERDVLTISQQTLTSAQKSQVRTNIGAASAEGLALIGTIKSFSLSSSQKLLTVADNNDICPIGISIINLANGDDSDLPSSSYKYGKAIVEKYATHRIVVTIRSVIDSTKVAVNRMDSSNAWLGWRTLVDSNDVYNGLDKTSAGFVLDARQGKKLMARSTMNTLVVRSSGTASGTSASVSTYGGRKFSDYWMLGFFMYSSTSDSIIRDVRWIDASHWTSGVVIQTIANHGASLESVSGIQFSYNSDTSVSVITIGAGSLTNFEIIGLLNQ